MCGDSTNKDDVERLMNGDKADMVFTDPPYGVDVVGGDKAVGGGKIVKSNRYERVIGDMNPDVARDACSLLVNLNIKPMVIWGANNFAHALPESSAWLYWQKNQTGDFADGELAWTNAKGQIKRFEHTWAGLIKASEHGEKRCHPTQKPVALAEWCFEKYGADKKSVIDLFLGSGSTLIACEKTNRKCYGMEIDEHYWNKTSGDWPK
jgi:DNA modification methylase